MNRQSMIFFSTRSNLGYFEEEEGEESIDDALLGELDDELEDGDDLLSVGLTPILKEASVDELEDDEDTTKEDMDKLFEDDDDTEYDSFDDRDEM